MMIRTFLALAALVAAFLMPAGAQNYPGIGTQILVTGTPYFADCTGTVDATNVIQNAINALPANGGEILFPGGCTFKISTPLNLGNGTSSTASTINGIVLKGIGVPNSFGSLFGGTYATGPTLTWAGTGQPMIQVNGPIQGWGVQNLRLNCASTSGSNGIFMRSALHGDVRNVSFNNCQGAILGNTYPQGPLSGQDANNEDNHFQNIVITVPNINTAYGIQLTGQATDTTSNSAFNIFTNLEILFPNLTNSNSMFGIILQDADSNVFIDTEMFGGASISGCVGVNFSYTDHTQWPSSNMFYGIDPAGNTCPTKFQNNGTPGAAAPNYIIGLVEANGATVPNLANLAVHGSKQLVFSPGGNTVNVQFNPVPVTIASLPTCNASTLGSRYTVSNQNGALSYGGTLTAGGTTTVGVFCNGTNWVMD